MSNTNSSTPTYKYNPPSDSELSYPLQRFELKRGRERQLALYQRSLLTSNGFSENKEKNVKIYYECMTFHFDKFLSDLSCLFSIWNRTGESYANLSI